MKKLLFAFLFVVMLGVFAPKSEAQVRGDYRYPGGAYWGNGYCATHPYSVACRNARWERAAFRRHQNWDRRRFRQHQRFERRWYRHHQYRHHRRWRHY